MGGKYFALKRGEPTGFNPFQFKHTEDNPMFCEKLVRQLVKSQEQRPRTDRSRRSGYQPRRPNCYE